MKIFLINGDETIIKGINIVVALEDGSGNVLCSSVIGMPNIISINSGYPEYVGKILTSDNMKYCTMEFRE